MKTFKKATIVLTWFFCVSALLSCKKENKTNYTPFLINVDSIKLPEKIHVDEAFDIQFFGTIGTNGCFQFHQFSTVKQDNNIIVEIWGKVNRAAEVCPQVMVYLEGKELKVTIEEKGNYNLKIKQADGSYLMEVILVE